MPSEFEALRVGKERHPEPAPAPNRWQRAKLVLLRFVLPAFLGFLGAAGYFVYQHTSADHQALHTIIGLINQNAQQQAQPQRPAVPPTP